MAMKLMRIPVWAVLFGHLAIMTALGQTPVTAANEAFITLKTRIEANYFAYDGGVARTLYNDALRQIEKQPDAMYPCYYAGLVSIQLGNIARASDRKGAYRHYLNAVQHLRVAFERVPNAENTIVLANAYGKLASLQTFKMFFYGSRSKSYLEDAFKLTMHSPKNYLIAGIEIMWTPRIFGGSKKKARKFLNKALVLEQQYQESDPYIVRWATSPEIMAYLAQLAVLEGKPEQGLQWAHRALQLVPDYGFVLQDVMPQLEGGR